MLGIGAISSAMSLGAYPRMANSSDVKPKRGGRLRIGSADASLSDNLNPELVETQFAINLNLQCRNCLIEMGPKSSLVPELATEWSSSEDLKTWTVRLRRGVTFHNGKEFNSSDALYSVRLHMGEKSTSPVRALLAEVVDLTAPDADTISFTLSAPNAGFPSILANTSLVMLAEGDTDFNKGMGTGGYILETFEPGVRSVTRRNPNYWKEGRAHFDEIEMIGIKDVTARLTALQTDLVDAINFVDPTLAGLIETMPMMNLLRTPSKTFYTFAMNTAYGAFADLNVRTALKFAINREEMIEKVVRGYGTIGNDQPITPAYSYYNTNLQPKAYDPEKAKFLLAKAGHSDLTLDLHASETPFIGAVDAVQLYKEQAAMAGITINLHREPEDGYWSNVWSKKPFVVARWNGRANEDVMLSSGYSSGSIPTGWNDTKWHNEAFDKVLIAARGERDDARRRELYAECQNLISKEGGSITFAHTDILDATSSKVQLGELSSEWPLDGARCAERWWFA